MIRDGWYITGDVGSIEPDGFIRITGRLSRFAKIAGEMVPLEQLEEEMHEILATGGDRVLAVAAVPDEKRGERLVVLYLPEVEIALAGPARRAAEARHPEPVGAGPPRLLPGGGDARPRQRQARPEEAQRPGEGEGWTSRPRRKPLVAMSLTTLPRRPRPPALRRQPRRDRPRHAELRPVRPRAGRSVLLRPTTSKPAGWRRTALGVLDSARVVPDLGDALADCVFTLATSALTAGVSAAGMIGTPAETDAAIARGGGRGPVALVFGPEPHGLSNEEIGRCHGLDPHPGRSGVPVAEPGAGGDDLLLRVAEGVVRASVNARAAGTRAGAGSRPARGPGADVRAPAGRVAGGGLSVRRPAGHRSCTRCGN